MMNIDETLIKNINAASDEILVDVCLSNGLLSAHIGTIAELKALAAELKEYREFVGAMKLLFEQIGGFMNTRTPCSCWAIIPQQCGRCILLEKITSLATGTDPLDAWRKMRNLD